MSAKKSFSIPKNLATGIRTSVQSATSNHGQLHYDMMSLDVIEPDPNNPRKLEISREELLNGLNKSDPNYEKKQKDLESLTDLAESIKRVGVRNAIEVYKEDSIYRIISGERRFLASLISGQKYIPARISQKLDEFKLRYIQWVENINRQDLSLWEKYNNLVSMAAAFKKADSSELEVKTLQELLGISERQAYRYLCLLNADPEIIELVKLGKLTNLKLIQDIALTKNKNTRLELLQKIRTSSDETTSFTKFKTLKDKTKLRRQTINLGKINNTNTAKYLIDVILRDSNFTKYQTTFNHVDWSSPKAINQAFKNLFKLIENELNEKETANEI